MPITLQWQNPDSGRACVPTSSPTVYIYMDWTGESTGKRAAPTTLQASLDASVDSWSLPDDMNPGYWNWMIVYSNGELNATSETNS